MTPTTHYRRLTVEELEALRDRLAQTVRDPETGEPRTVRPSVYDTLASFQAVQVGDQGEEDPLPDETEKRPDLEASGFDTVGKARRGDLKVVSGIGETTEKRIKRSLPPTTLLVHVFGPDREGLPGVALGEDLDAIEEKARGRIRRARIRRRDAEGHTVEELVPEAKVPDGAEVVETGIPPHAFA